MVPSFPRYATLLLLLTLAATGCAQRGTLTGGGVTPPFAQGAQIDSATFDMKQGQVTASKKIPKLIELGQEVSYSIQLVAREDATNVTVREEIPVNTKYLRSDPEGIVSGNQLVWRFPQLQRGATRTLNITLKPEREGRIEGYTSVTVEPQVYAATVVGQPKLVVRKTAPATAMVGSDVNYTLEVTNTGTYLAKAVVLTDLVPAGMSHASGSKEVVVQVGDIQPGQTRTVPLVLKSTQKGQAKNVARVDAANAAAVAVESSTLMMLQTLRAANKGPDDQYVGKPVSYDITVSNPGDVPLKNVLVTNSMPSEGRILQASGAAVSGNSATWSIAQLAPGETQKFNVVATALTAGVYKNMVNARSAEGVVAESEYATLWRGLPGLSLQMADSADPVREGDRTEFNITLTNQGTASDTNVRVQMSFPAGLQPLSSSGATTATITDQLVSFAPVVNLAPKQSLTWVVVAKGTAVGDNRTRVQYTSDSIKVPVSKDESTQVY
jgi:uncharacterized repeat protein (TIGR01451 family)